MRKCALGARSVGRRPDCLVALTFWIRRAIFALKRLDAIFASLQLQIDVWIRDFVTGRPVSHDQKRSILVGDIQEVVPVSSTCRECDTSARPDILAPSIGDEDEFTFDDEDEFILARVGVPGRRLAAGLNTYEVHSEVFEPAVIG